MKQLLIILFLLIGLLTFAQTDTTYLRGDFFITDWIHKNKLNIVINKWQIIEPVKIKGNLYMIPNEVYLENKKLVESRIDLNKCVIRKVKKNELIESE